MENQQKQVFRMASMFDGEKYVGVFCAQTGELIYHEKDGRIILSDKNTKDKESKKETDPNLNKNQLSIF